MLLATTGARAASGAWSRLAALHGAPVIIAGWIAFGVLVYLIGMVVSVGCYWIQMMLDGEPDDQITLDHLGKDVGGGLAIWPLLLLFSITCIAMMGTRLALLRVRRAVRTPPLRPAGPCVPVWGGYRDPPRCPTCNNAIQNG
jgi:hypothetical protein